MVPLLTTSSRNLSHAGIKRTRFYLYLSSPNKNSVEYRSYMDSATSRIGMNGFTSYATARIPSQSTRGNDRLS